MSRTKSTSTEVKEVRALAEEMKAQQKATMDKVVGVLRKMINTNDKLQGIQWRQYTPSFNDGDACDFTLGDVEFKIEGLEEYTDEYSIKDFIDKQKDVLDYKEMDALKKTCKQICAVYEEFGELEGSLKEAFGNNMRITLTRDGIETEDYDPEY